MSDHSRFASTATRLIAKHGRDVVLKTVTKTGPSYDPTITEVSSTVKAVQTDFTKSERDQGLVSANSKVYLIDSVVPILKSMKLVDGLEMSIVSVEEEKPGDQVIMYRVIANG